MMCVFGAVTFPRTALCSLRRCTSRGACASSSVCPHTPSTSASGLTRRWAGDTHTHTLFCEAVMNTLQPDFVLSPQLMYDMDKEIFPMVVQAVVDEGEGEWRAFCSADLLIWSPAADSKHASTFFSLCRTSRPLSHTAGYIWKGERLFCRHCGSKHISVLSFWLIGRLAAKNLNLCSN